jgi:hypothetical protein
MDRMVIVGLIANDTNAVAGYLDGLSNIISYIEKKDDEFNWGSYIALMANLSKSGFYNSLVVNALRVFNLDNCCIEDIEIKPQMVKSLYDVINTYDVSIKGDANIFDSLDTNKVYPVIHKGKVVKPSKSRFGIDSLGLNRFRVIIRGLMNSFAFENNCFIDIDNRTFGLYVVNRLVYGDEIEHPAHITDSVVELSCGDLNDNFTAMGDYCVKFFDTFYVNIEVKECIVPNGVKTVIINVAEKVLDCLMVIPPSVEGIFISSFNRYHLNDRHLNFKIKLLLPSSVNLNLTKEILANLYNDLKSRYLVDSSLELDDLIERIERNTKFSIDFY